MGTRKAALLNLCQQFDLDIGVKPRRGAAFTVYEKARLALALEDRFNIQRVDLISLRDMDEAI